jgi:hypothetical protein
VTEGSPSSARRKQGTWWLRRLLHEIRNNVQMLHRLLKDNYFGRVTRFVHQFGTPGAGHTFRLYAEPTVVGGRLADRNRFAFPGSHDPFLGYAGDLFPCR